MNNHGFGFSASNNGDDENDKNNENHNNSGKGGGESDSTGNSNNGGFNPNNPFEGFGFGGQGFTAFPGGFAFGAPTGGNNSGGEPGLGDILSQFGQMLSGMGSSMNSPDNEGSVNFSLAKKIASQAIAQSGTSANHVKESDRQAVTDSARLVELWLDDATALDTTGATVEVWTPSQWLENTLPTWKRFVTPVAESLVDAQQDALPEEAKQMAGPLLSMMSQMGGMNMGMQLGHVLGELATTTSMTSEWGIPLTESNSHAILTHTLDTLSEELGQPKREILIYLCARELAHQRLFHHVPWLDEHLVLAVEGFAQGLAIDNSAMEEASRSIDPEALSDPARLQDAIQNLQNMDVSPKIVTSNEKSGVQLDTLLSLVEGWVDVVVSESLSERIPATQAIHKSWTARRAMTSGLAKLSGGVGLDLSAQHADEAAELWRRLTVAVGTQRRDQVWDHPDFLPVSEDLAKPAEFIDSILGEADEKTFDPISEIEQLEKELNAQNSNEEASADGSSTGEGSGSQEGPGRQGDRSENASDDASGDDSPGETGGGSGNQHS